MANPRNPGEVGLPLKTFFYSGEQVCALLGVSKHTLIKDIGFFEGREIGRQPRDRIRFVNVAARDSNEEDWRVEEQEFIRWLRAKGIQVHRTAFSHPSSAKKEWVPPEWMPAPDPD